MLCIERHQPFVVRYERLLENTRDELAHLLTYLGLSHHHIEKQIDSCRDGKNIPIPGVFREGKSGNWKKEFSEKDIEVFKRIGGHILIRLGYETDVIWDFR